jgi:hypothetical protein
LNRGVIHAPISSSSDELVAIACFPDSWRPASLMKKSASTAGGVTLLGGSGPFHAFRRHGGLDRRSPVGDDDAGRRLTSRQADLGGDDDLALGVAVLAARVFFSQTLDASVGKPILVQKSVRSSSPLRPLSGGDTRGSSASPCQATSSANGTSSSPSENSHRAPKREPDLGEKGAWPAGDLPDPIGGRISLRRGLLDGDRQTASLIASEPELT